MVSTLASFDTSHEDMIHDAQMDYYGRRLATASSDRTIRIFEIEGENHRLLQILKGHDGPVWQVTWSHPKIGNYLASCSYDGRVLIWKEQSGRWDIIKEHRVHDASVNSIAWAPHEFGLLLACASSDGNVSLLSLKSDGQWDAVLVPAHSAGCNAVAWAPALPISGGNAASTPVKRFASAGCENVIRVWKYKEEEGGWAQEAELTEHKDWVRDLAWAHNVGGPGYLLASCSQDKTVIIWTKDNDEAKWNHRVLHTFQDVVWRVSWSVTGTILAVSSGDAKVSLWKQAVDGSWERISDVEEGSTAPASQFAGR